MVLLGVTTARSASLTVFELTAHAVTCDCESSLSCAREPAWPWRVGLPSRFRLPHVCATCMCVSQHGGRENPLALSVRISDQTEPQTPPPYAEIQLPNTCCVVGGAGGTHATMARERQRRQSLSLSLSRRWKTRRAGRQHACTRPHTHTRQALHI